MQDILDVIMEDHYIIDRGHLKFFVSTGREWRTAPVDYGQTPMFQLDMDNMELWVSFRIWETFRKKGLSDDDIKTLVADVFKSKFNYDTKPY